MKQPPDLHIVAVMSCNSFYLIHMGYRGIEREREREREREIKSIMLYFKREKHNTTCWQIPHSFTALFVHVFLLLGLLYKTVPFAVSFITRGIFSCLRCQPAGSFFACPGHHSRILLNASTGVQTNIWSTDVHLGATQACYWIAD